MKKHHLASGEDTEVNPRAGDNRSSGIVASGALGDPMASHTSSLL